tara:strand:+ start:2381 stop:3742 length:1362 start_codon:yes stop_codon:yes gene_type:complete
MSNENSPIGGQQSTSVQLQKATLRSSRTATSIDITSVVLELSMYENLARPFITGYLALIDSERIVENFDIQGAEEIELIFKRSTEKSSVREIKQNWIIQKIEAEHNVQEFTNVVVFRLIDKESFRSGLKNVNKCLYGQPWEIIDQILVEYLDRDDLRTSADLNNSEKMKVIVPNMTPIEATQWIRNRSLNQNGYPFYFYKSAMTGEYFFADLETLIASPVVNENLPLSPNQSAGSSESKSTSSTIYKMEQSDVDNLYSLIRSGIIGSENKYYDVTRGDFEIVDFNVNNDLLVELQSLNSRQEKPLLDGRLAFDDVSISNYKAKSISQISGARVYDDVKSYDETQDIGDSRKKIKAHAIRELMLKTPLSISVEGDRWIHGDNHYGVGNNIKILVRSKADDPENPSVDRKQSGDYLIITAKYVLDLTQGKVGATFKCAKFGNYQNSAYNVGGGGK